MTKKDFPEAERLARSDAARQLFAYLNEQDADAVRSATRQAAAGDYAQAAQSLRALLASPEAQRLLRQLGG